MKQCLIFDLDDTLTESKQPISVEMRELLEKLTDHFHIAIISGCKYQQMEEQVIRHLGSCHFDKTHWLPTSGAQYYHEFDRKYYHGLTDQEKAYVQMVGWSAIDNFTTLWPQEVYGAVAEDRETQITFSLCGQEAPIEVKRAWNAEHDHTRWKAAERLQTRLSEFTVRVGGLTSIDITLKGIDKAFGVEQFMKATGFTKEDVLFFGDQLQPGGNDYAVKQMGIDCIEVKNVEETLEILKEILDGPENLHNGIRWL